MRAGQCGVCGRPVHRAGSDVGAPSRAGASAGLRRVGISWAEAGERTGWARREKRRAAWAAGGGKARETGRGEEREWLGPRGE